jgi:hypothetical protein
MTIVESSGLRFDGYGRRSPEAVHNLVARES